MKNEIERELQQLDELKVRVETIVEEKQKGRQVIAQLEEEKRRILNEQSDTSSSESELRGIEQALFERE